jgi:hypothetical protein
VLPADALAGVNSNAAAIEASATVVDNARGMDLDMELSSEKGVRENQGCTATVT